MVSHGFVKSEYDHCVYINKVTKGTYIYLLLYVDDKLVASRDAVEIMKVKQVLSGRFEMNDLDPARRISGTNIERDHGKKILTLSQSGYIKNILRVFDMDESVCVNANCLP